jgi:hypothetical protein
VINFQVSPDDVGIAAEMALPEAVIKNSNRVAAALSIGGLDVAAEKRPHAKESPGIFREVDARDVFRQSSVSNLHVPCVIAKRRINRGGKAQVIKLCFAEGNKLKPVRMFLVETEEVHDAVGVGVRKRVQQDGVDEREHRRGGADAERE